MSVSLQPTRSQIQTALRAFLLSILAAGVEVVQGQDNRVPEPGGGDFVVFWFLDQLRLSTNIDGYSDSTFVGSISGNTLTITSVVGASPLSLAVGVTVFGASIAPNTVITALGTGTGGVGTYTVNNSQTVGSALIAAGGANFEQPTQHTFQLDVHGPASGDNAQIISTMFRDQFAVDSFAATLGNDTVSPLYADDPKQVPFINSENQYETRWIVRAVLQANQTISGVPQQFAAAANVGVISVEETYH